MSAWGYEEKTQVEQIWSACPPIPEILTLIDIDAKGSGVMLGCAQGAYELVVGAARNATPPTPTPACRSTPARQSRSRWRRQARSSTTPKSSCGGPASTPCRSPAPAARRLTTTTCATGRRLLLDPALLRGGQPPDGRRGLGRLLHHWRHAVGLFRDAQAANAYVMFSPDIQGQIFGQHALGTAGLPPLM